MADDATARRADVIGRWLAAVEGSVAESVAESGVELPAPPGTSSSAKPAPDQMRARVDAHLAAAECPAGHLAPREEFEDSAMTSAREIGLEALRRNPAGGSRDPIREVASTIGETTIFRPGLGRWLEEIDRAERAAVIAAAASWMVDALALGARHGEPTWHGPAHRSHNLKSAPVAIAARVDATRQTRAGSHFLVLAPGARGSDERLGRRVALVSAVAYGEVPAQVHLGYRDTVTRSSHDIDDRELDLAVSELTEDVGWRLRPSTAPRRPGRSCRWCSLAEDCPEGTAHLEATRGAPVPPWLVPEPTPREPGTETSESGAEAPAQGSSADGGEPTM